jgi:hypothetical protein
MAGEQHNPPPPYPFSTPIPANASPEDLENHCRTLEAALKKELEERRKFRLEHQSTNALSNYRQRRMLLRVDPDYLVRSLNFDDGPQRVANAERGHNAAPGGSRPGGSRGAPPPPPPPPPPNQQRVPQQEVDANGLPLHSSPMENVVAVQVAVQGLNPTDEDAVNIRYCQALIAKSVEQQYAHADS